MSKKHSINQTYPMTEAGRRDGLAWRPKATKGQLVRLQRFARANPDLAAWFDDREAQNQGDEYSISPSDFLAVRIDLATLNGTRDYCEFWFDATAYADDADLDDIDYLTGFIEGALEAPAKKTRGKTRRRAA